MPPYIDVLAVRAVLGHFDCRQDTPYRGVLLASQLASLYSGNRRCAASHQEVVMDGSLLPSIHHHLLKLGRGRIPPALPADSRPLGLPAHALSKEDGPKGP